jgi:hypothetical protein
VRTSFADHNADRLVGAPIDWIASEGTSERSANNQLVMPFTVGTRLTRSFVRASVWGWFLDDPSATYQVSSGSYEFQLLDANFTMAAAWGFPSFGFPGSNEMQFNVQQGTATMTCLNLNATMAEAQYANLAAATNLHLVQNVSGMYNVYPELLDVNASHVNLNLTVPQFPVPNALVADTVAALMDTYLPQINVYLAADQLAVPAEVTQVLLSPRMLPRRSVAQGPDGLSGFLELTSRCVCGGPPGQTQQIDTLYGTETVVSCASPCPPAFTNGRRSMDAPHAKVFEEAPAREYAPVLQGLLPSQTRPVRAANKARAGEGAWRRALSLTDGTCTNVPGDYSLVSQAMVVMLNCMTQTQTNSFSPDTARWECMRQGALAAWPNGACDVTHPFNAVRHCDSPLSDVWLVRCLGSSRAHVTR